MKNKGFSLVELIIVIAIMAILVATITPALLKYVEKSNRSKDIYNAKSMMKTLELAYADGSIQFEDSNSAVWIYVTKTGTQTFINGQTKFPTINGASGSAALTEFPKLMKECGIDTNVTKVSCKKVTDTGVAATDEGWNWYCVYLTSDGIAHVASAPGNAGQDYLRTWGNFKARILGWADRDESSIARAINGNAGSSVF